MGKERFKEKLKEMFKDKSIFQSITKPEPKNPPLKHSGIMLDLCYNLLYSVDLMAKDLVEELRTYRLEHRLSQIKLAERLGVTFQTVNRWLNRHVKPSQLQEYQIRKLLDNHGRLGFVQFLVERDSEQSSGLIVTPPVLELAAWTATP